MHFRFENEFACEPAAFWAMFFDERYNRELYERVGMRERRVLELVDDGKTIRRATWFQPDSDMPAAFRAVVKDTGYTERNVYYRDRSAMDVTIEPAILRTKLEFRATSTVARSGGARCRRVFEGDAKVHVMVIGGQLEKYLVEQMRASYDVSAAFTREWLLRGGPSPT